MKQTLILTLRVEDHHNGRKDLESIENNVYQAKNEFEVQQLVNKELGFKSTKNCFIFRWALEDLERISNSILQGLNRFGKVPITSPPIK